MSKNRVLEGELKHLCVQIHSSKSTSIPAKCQQGCGVSDPNCGRLWRHSRIILDVC